MGIKNLVTKAGKKAADGVAKLSVLSPEQLKDIETKRTAYLSQMPSLDDETANELTNRLIAMYGVEVYNAYLPQISDLYAPIEQDLEYERPFSSVHNIRYFNITKWVTDKKENSLEKLVNVYEALASEDCNIALVFHRSCSETEVYIAIVNNNNADDNVDVELFKRRIADSLRGNFPGSEWVDKGMGELPFMKYLEKSSVASVSNVPTEKSEKFISQTIEKLLDGVVPENQSQEYTLILLATPVQDVEMRKLRLAELYSGLAPYSAWTTNFTYTETDSNNSSATFGVNAGVSAGLQQSQNQTVTNTNGVTNSTGSSTSDNRSTTTTETNGQTVTNTEGQTVTDTTSNATSNSVANGTNASHTHTDGHNTSTSHSDGENSSSNWSLILGGHNWGDSSTDTSSIGASVSNAVTSGSSYTVTEGTTSTVGQSIANAVTSSIANSTSNSVGQTIGRTVANTLGRAVSTTLSAAEGITKGVNLGGNFGANFARSSNVTATVGKNEGITQNFQNYSIKHTLEILEQQMQRMDLCSALGMWDFAAYVISDDQYIARNVANSYLALTQGEKSFTSQAAINFWRGDKGDESKQCREICGYLKDFRHPVFGLNPVVIEEEPQLNVYPSIVTATTCLSGKELSYSLNFPRKSIAGLPVLECADFGRDVVTYDREVTDKRLSIGKIYHMHHSENKDVNLSVKSLTSHTFVTGSTGSGKSNTVYKLLSEALNENINFLVIEPAKGEYKEVFGCLQDVQVYGTNQELSELLRINPFSFPKGIHVFEHIDRLVEIFNVCWPMYAAMPAVLKNAIEESYVDCGWDLVESTNRYSEEMFPTFKDVARNIKSIIDSSEYDNENKGAYKGSLLTRLKSLTNGINGLVFTIDELSGEELFDNNVIVDLSRVGSSETKSLLMGMLVMKQQEYRLATKAMSNASLKHITVLEEAHNLLKRTPMGSPTEGGNLAGKSVEMLSNAIAEMRTYGEGFIIVDQAPGLLDPSVIRNTNTKIIMRLPDQEDRELVGRAACLNDDQISELAKLPCGVGALYQNEWVQPVLCQIDRFEGYNDSFFYERIKQYNKVDRSKRIKIFELLSNCEYISDEEKKEELERELIDQKVLPSIRTVIYDALFKKHDEPNMTKLALVADELFPELTEEIKVSSSENLEYGDWTERANAVIDNWNLVIDEQVRRDLIQSGFTYYMLYVLNNVPLLKEWCEKGGL